MNRIATIFSKKKGYKKVLFILGIICSLSIIVLAIMQLPVDVLEPLVGVLMLIQSLGYWKKNRNLAIFSLLVALFIFFVAITKFVF